MTVILAGSQGLKRTYHRSASTLKEYHSNFKEFLHVQQKMLRHAIVVDQVLHVHEKVRSLCAKLKAHMYRNVIKVGKQHYLQTVGISQGAVTSTLLCNLYYAEMEKEILSVRICQEGICELKGKEHCSTKCSWKEDELLMRMVDDFLFVTPHLERAEKFLQLLNQGIPEYNCYISPSKTLTSFTNDITGSK